MDCGNEKGSVFFVMQDSFTCFVKLKTLTEFMCKHGNPNITYVCAFSMFYLQCACCIKD